MVGGPRRGDAQVLKPDIGPEKIIERVACESDMLQAGMAVSVRIVNEPRRLEQDDAMVRFIVADEGEGRERRTAPRLRRDFRPMDDRHAERLAIPVDHGVQLGCRQPVVVKLRMDDDLGVHFHSPFTLGKGCASWMRRSTFKQWPSDKLWRRPSTDGLDYP